MDRCHLLFSRAKERGKVGAKRGRKGGRTRMWRRQGTTVKSTAHVWTIERASVTISTFSPWQMSFLFFPGRSHEDPDAAHRRKSLRQSNRVWGGSRRSVLVLNGFRLWFWNCVYVLNTNVTNYVFLFEWMKGIKRFQNIRPALSQSTLIHQHHAARPHFGNVFHSKHLAGPNWTLWRAGLGPQEPF